MMRLFWIFGDDLHFARHVAAQHPGEAVRIWREHHNFSDDYAPSAVIEIPTLTAAGVVETHRWEIYDTE